MNIYTWEDMYDHGIVIAEDDYDALKKLQVSNHFDVDLLYVGEVDDGVLSIVAF